MRRRANLLTARGLAPTALAIALGLVATTAGPARSQSPKPIMDLQTLAGEWRAEVHLRDGSKAPATWSIRDTGQWESKTERGTNTGTIQLKDGKALFKYDGSGNIASFTLHESPDKQPWLHGRNETTGSLWHLWRGGKDATTTPPPQSQPPTAEAFRGQWSGSWVSGNGYGNVEAEIGSLTTEKGWILAKITWAGGGDQLTRVLDLKKGELTTASPTFEITFTLKGDKELVGDYYNAATRARGRWTLTRK